MTNYDYEIEKRYHPENFEMDGSEEDLEIDPENKGVPTLNDTLSEL